jgi:phosphate:Na+ symporter
LPEPTKSPDPSAPLYLDETAIHTPSVALACAAREVLRMGDIVETMLRQAMTALMTNDRKLAAEVSRMDNSVDRLHEAIKLFVTRVTRESLDDLDGRRAMEIISFSINLEHIADIIDKNLMEVAAKKIKHKYQFSKEGAAELEGFHKRILDNFKIAIGVFMNGNVKTARTLIEEKAPLRQAEPITPSRAGGL